MPKQARTAVRAARKIGTLTVACLAALTMIAIRPVWWIRIGKINKKRIGHFALNTELAVQEAALARLVTGAKIVDIYYSNDSDTCNMFLLELWKEKIRFIEGYGAEVLDICMRILEIIPMGKLNISTSVQGDRDVLGILGRTEPSIKLSKTQMEEGLRQARLHFGIPEEAKIVVAIVRDSSYLDKTYPGIDWSYHNYRDNDIEAYIDGFNKIAGSGYYVLRMGKVVNKPLDTEKLHDRVIDYASSDMRSDFLDVYFAARADFCVSTGTGYDALACVFRKPVLYTDFAPVGHLHTSMKGGLALFKAYVDKETGRRLTLDEIFDRGLAFELRKEGIDARGVRLVNNTASEIKHACMEMVDQIENSSKTNIYKSRLHSEFWSSFIKGVSSYGSDMHGEIRINVCNAYLEKNANDAASDA